MKVNCSMKALLEKYSIDSIAQNHTYPIWHKTDIAGRMYWGVDSFCGMDKHPICADQDLSLLEWDGNEVYLYAHTKKAVADMLRNALGILVFWKSELQTRYSDTSFYLFASYDHGNRQSITLRFWADRGENTVIDLSTFDHWEQPAIMEYIQRTT